MRGLYVVSCLLYLAVNAIVILVAGASAPDTIRFAIANSLPPSLLGIAVVRYFYRGDRLTALARNVLLALGFGATCVGASMLIMWLIEPRMFAWRLANAVWALLIQVLLFIILAAVANVYRVQRSLSQERERTVAAEAARAKAELEAMRARVDPHFLFNTLHSLLALVRQDPGRAEEAIEQFADILRYTFSAGEGGEERTLAQEWELVNNYLALERLRLGARLRVREELDPAAANARVPVLTLQPLVENAVRHAIAPRAAGGLIELTATRTSSGVQIVVADDGSAADPESIVSAEGHGLHLVRERLERMYRGKGSLRLSQSKHGGLCVTIELS